MLQFHLSKTLAKQMQSLLVPAPDIRPEGMQWYAQGISLLGEQCILAIEAHSRYLMVFCNLPITELENFPLLFRERLWREVIAVCLLEDKQAQETLGELAQQITRLPLPAGVSVSLYTRHKWLIDRPLAELSELHDGTGFSFEVVDIPAYSDNDIGKVLYAGAPEQLKILEDAIRAGFEGQIHMTYSQPMYLEIMGKGVNKGLALQALLHELGLDRQHCYAFGDNLNDVEMLSLAGNAHVMANAHPYLADNLPHATVIGHHNDKAVARQLRSLFALED